MSNIISFFLLTFDVSRCFSLVPLLFSSFFFFREITKKQKRKEKTKNSNAKKSTKVGAECSFFFFRSFLLVHSIRIRTKNKCLAPQCLLCFCTCLCTCQLQEAKEPSTSSGTDKTNPCPNNNRVVEQIGPPKFSRNFQKCEDLLQVFWGKPNSDRDFYT